MKKERDTSKVFHKICKILHYNPATAATGAEDHFQCRAEPGCGYSPHSPSNTDIYSCHCRDCYLNWFLKNVFPQVLVVLSIQIKRSCSRYITSMATLRLRWTSSQVNTVTLFTRVPGTDQPLVREASTCTYRATLQATVIPTPTVATATLSPLVTLHLVTPVDFMQEVDPVSTSLPLMLKCFTRQQLKLCKLKAHHVCQSKQYKYI